MIYFNHFTAHLYSSALDKIVPVPFPGDEDTILASLGPPDSRCRSFLLDRVEPDLPELERMVGTLIDVDDLNCYAKLLDCIDDWEVLEAAALADRPETLRDLINLTMDLPNYAVITDYSNLADIGRKIRFAETGGRCEIGDCMTDGRSFVEKGKEFVNHTPRRTARGDVYRFGSYEYDQYVGRVLPPILFDSSAVADVVLAARDRTTEKGFWLQLPAADAYLQTVAMRLGVESVEDLRIESVDETESLLTKLEPVLRVKEAPVSEINALCRRLHCCGHNINQTDGRHQGHLLASVSLSGACGAGEIGRLVDHIDEFALARGVLDAESYGRHILHEAGWRQDPELEPANAEKYRALGKAMIDIEGGRFTDWGYVCHRGPTPMEEILARSGPDQVMGDAPGLEF